MFQENIPLSAHSNYKIGGPARFFVFGETVDEITKAVTMAKGNKLPIMILGGGTNILFPDAGFDGLVIKLNLKAIKRDPPKGEAGGNLVRVGAGATVAELINFTLQEKLSGLQWAGGLPGSVGGAIWGNAGAFGGETKDSILDVTSLEIDGEKPIIHVRKNKELKFGYRTSIFKEKGGEIILSATFELKPGDADEMKKIIEEKKQYRKDRQPLEHPNIGSIFKNIDVKKLPKEIAERFKDRMKADPFPVLPVAILISEAGLKNTRVGDAMVSPKHPNFIVNMGKATAKDVKSLMGIVRLKVREQFGVELEQEVIFW